MCALLLLPAITMAEGAVRVLSCEITRQCDAAGQCSSHDETVEFRMSPEAQRSDGSGDFTLQYRGKELPMTAISDIGPFVWIDELDHYTLLASSEDLFLLHVLSLADTPAARIQFMRCTFRQ